MRPAPRPRWPACYGRSKRGSRCRAATRHGHWLTTTFTAALRRTALTAPMTLDGPMNAVAFHAYVEQVLAPTLDPGDIVVMDNLPAHEGAAVRAAMRPAAQALPCCRPIRPTSTQSECLRQVQIKLRKTSPEASNLGAAIADAFHSFTAQECANYFIAAG